MVHVSATTATKLAHKDPCSTSRTIGLTFDTNLQGDYGHHVFRNDCARGARSTRKSQAATASASSKLAMVVGRPGRAVRTQFFGTSRQPLRRRSIGSETMVSPVSSSRA